ncbi:MAG: thioredoxin TrxC [Usitatibacter sp.]
MSDSLHVVCPACATTNRVASERLGAGATCGHCKAPLFTGRPVELGAANFDRHLRSNDLPVVVDFWAPWCGPCRMMAPAYEQAAAKLSPRVRLAKLDTEANPEIGARFGIRSIPTLAVFRNGREIARQSGAMASAPQLIQWIESHVS